MSNPVTESKERSMSFGVGGAGNIRKAAATAPPPGALQTPSLKGKNYSTGRGGKGNIAKNDPSKPEIARKSQDVDVPPIKIEEEQHHIGRGTLVPVLAIAFQIDIYLVGGAANTYKPSDEEIDAAREDKEKVRSGSKSSFERPKGVVGLAKKGKEVLAGLKD